LVVLEAAFLTGIVVASLTLYTFWAVKRGADFSFLGPFLFASLMVMLMFVLIQVNILIIINDHYFIFVFLFISK
jgi:hypothetical protein